jgi:hypothetical protein
VPFFSILKEDTIQIGFANLLITSDNLFGEFASASILTPHEQWYEQVCFALESKHQQGFKKVCQWILGDLFGMFEAALLAPKTTTGVQFCLLGLHYLQGGHGSKFTARIQEMLLALHCKQEAKL